MRPSVEWIGQDNRLLDVKIGGNDLGGFLAGRAVQAAMSYASDQVGQFNLSLSDTGDGLIVNSGLLSKGATIDYGSQQLVITTVKHSPAPGGISVRIEAQSRVITALKKQVGKTSWGTTSMSGWVAARVSEAGGTSIVQELGSESITRQDGNDEESSMDVMRRLVDVAGAWNWEADQQVYFGRPSFLIARPDSVAWPFYWNSLVDHSDELTEYPEFDDTDDKESPQKLSLKFHTRDPSRSASVRPGDTIDYAGKVGAAAGRWIVTGVDISMSHKDPVDIRAERVIDPKPAKTA